MVFWTGTGEVHVTYLPRKPTPYGIEIKSLACGESCILLNAEVVEGKELDAQKKWRDEVGASTATTLRLCEPYQGTGRTIIGDAWFGSLNTAEWLMDVLGLHSILAVKTGHRGFPKEELIAEIAGTRFSQSFKKVEVNLECGTKTFYAGGFMDKKPMLVVGTCGTSLPGQQLQR